MNYIKTFENFVNEAHLPFDIEKKLRLGGISFEVDDDRTEEDDDERLDYAVVHSGVEKNSGTEWVIKTGTTKKGGYLLEIIEDDTVVFTHEYPASQKAYFDQDCVNSLGYVTDLD